MKKFTFLLTLLLAFVGVTASAQEAFVASSAPSNGSWASDTKWYKMSLDGNYLSAYSTDHNGSLLDNATTAEGAGAYWCVVGDETNGYKFYNRAAGPNKVFGIVSALTNDYNDVTRASFYTSATVSASSEVSTTFDLGLYTNSTNEYHAKRHGDGNFYWNHRGKYLGYWNSTEATNTGTNGSKVRFYAVETAAVEAADKTSAEAFKTALSEKITAAKKLVDDSKVGYYSQTAISKAQTVLDKETSTAADYYFAKIELKPNAPKAGVLYRIKSANANFKTTKAIYHNGTTTKWGDEDLTNTSQYWFIEPYGSFCYKLQAIDSKLYFNSSSQLSATPGYVEIASTPGLVDIRVSGADMLHAAGHNGGEGNEGNLTAYEENRQIFGQEAGPSGWTIVEATPEEAKQMRVSEEGTAEDYKGGLLVGTFDAHKAQAFNKKISSSTTMDEVLKLVNTNLPTVVTIDKNKYYRLVCVAPKPDNGDATYTTLTRGTNNVVTAPFSKGNVDQIWKFEETKDGYYLKNMNGNGYLNDVRSGATRAILVDTPSDKFELIDGSVNTQKRLHVVGLNFRQCLFAENHPNESYAVAGWYQSGKDGSDWKIVEADDIEVAMNAVGSNSYATAYLPFGVSAISGAEAYVGTLNAEKNALDMTEVKTISANKGVVLVGTTDATKATLTISNSNEALTIANDLTGTNTAITLTDDNRTSYLVFGKNKADNTKVGFFKTTATTIPANKAFLETSALTQEAIAMNFGGNTTGVNTVVLGENGVNAPVFDLSGRRVVAPVKGGVYIQNGKKFIK